MQTLNHLQNLEIPLEGIRSATKFPSRQTIHSQLFKSEQQLLTAKTTFPLQLMSILPLALGEPGLIPEFNQVPRESSGLPLRAALFFAVLATLEHFGKSC